MKEYQSLSHTRWDCNYHVVFIPRRRKKRIFGVLPRHLGEIFHELAAHKEAKIVEGHLIGDHVLQTSPPLPPPQAARRIQMEDVVSVLGSCNIFCLSMQSSYSHDEFYE